MCQRNSTTKKFAKIRKLFTVQILLVFLNPIRANNSFRERITFEYEGFSALSQESYRQNLADVFGSNGRVKRLFLVLESWNQVQRPAVVSFVAIWQIEKLRADFVL